MKQLLLSLILFFLSAAPIVAEDTGTKPTQKVGLEARSKSNTDKGQRAPLRLDIEVTCDAVTRTVEVTADESLDAEVYILLDGTTVDYSPVVNSTFYIPETSGQYTIEIEGGSWIATGVIPL